MRSDGELLCQYLQAHDQDAFAELVRRHVDLVYSAALRQVNGDTHLAQDVAQSVFIDLAKKATALSRRPSLGGWLYTSTHFAAAKAVRAGCRRRTHEQEAHVMHELLQDAVPEPDWSKVRPLLDKVMHQLNDSDREMLLMRFFQNRPLAEVGAQLGWSEEATRKRVERALDKLHGLFIKHGVTTTLSLASLISANAVQVAPAGLAATLSTGALAGTALTATTTAIIAKTTAMTTIQKTFMAAIFTVIGGAGFYEAYHASHLRDQVRTLQQQQALLTEQIERANSDNSNLSNQLALMARSPSIGSARLRELLRLRGEVGVLRRQQGELEQALAAARSNGPRGDSPSPSAATQPAAPVVPFRVQLVANEPGQDTEPMTNSTLGAKQEVLHVDKTPLMDYTAIRSATAAVDPSSGEPQINIELNPEGKELFAAVTRENLNRRLAIVLNGQLYAAPVVRSEISGGQVQITGHFTEQEAQQFAAKINEAIR